MLALQMVGGEDGSSGFDLKNADGDAATVLLELAGYSSSAIAIARGHGRDHVRRAMELGALVRVRGPDARRTKHRRAEFWSFENGVTTLSASGFLLDARTVVTTAQAVRPFLGADGRSLQPGATVEVMLSAAGGDGFGGRWLPADLRQAPAAGEAAAAAVRALLPSGGWRLGGEELRARGGEHAVQLARLVLRDPVPRHLAQLRPPTSLVAGEPLTLVSSPFGAVSPALFLNSLAAGVVSSVVRDAEGSAVLLLTDARALPCSAGGALLDRQQALIGFLLPLLQRSDGSAVGLSLAAALPPSLLLPDPERVLPVLAAGRPRASAGRADPAAVLERAGCSLAMVCAGRRWASGVVFSRSGHVLTNAHALVGDGAEAGTGRLRVWLRPQGEAEHVRCAATVLYNSKGALDLALLLVHLPRGGTSVPVDAGRASAAAADAAVEAGQEVLVVGHALFGQHWRQPTITAGTLSRVVTRNGWPAMLQSSAAVHGGNSGGMLLDGQGQLLGIVTNNVRHENALPSDKAPAGRRQRQRKDQLLPRLNFSIPLRELLPLLAAAGIGPAASGSQPPRETPLSAAQCAGIAAVAGEGEELRAMWALERGPGEAGKGAQGADKAPGGPAFRKYMHSKM